MKERRVEGWRSETTANWANSLSRQHNLALFFSPYSLYSRGSLVYPIVSSFTRILPPPFLSFSLFLSQTMGQIHFVFIKFHKASPSRQHRCIFHFLVSTGTVQKGSVMENGEHGRGGEGGDDYLRPLARCLSFFLCRSPIPCLSPCHLSIHLYTRVRLFLSLPA